MTAVVAAGRRYLPRGWTDFAFQVVIWLGFYFSYLGVRSLVDTGDQAKALINGVRVIDLEQKVSSTFIEHVFQRVAEGSQVFMTAVAWTYWNSEFTVIGLTLLFVYLRRHERFARFRNTILLANMVGLIGYIVMPTAPPWMFPSFGFVDGVNHTGLVTSMANPFAAMPSLHSADALIVGVSMVGACRHWLAKTVWALWPAWVWFAVMATANHFWLDVLAGIVVAVFALVVVAKVSWLQGRAPEPAATGAPIANTL